VGFGIRDAATAQTIGKGADAVVIGSKLIQLVKAANQGEAPAAARDFMRGIRQALDA
jgi:tryptophan synthase alpha chain